MYLVALAKSATDICVRYRIEPMRKEMRIAGHWFEVQETASTILGRLHQFHQLKSADVVIVQRRLFSRYQIGVLRKSVRHLIFDFDDAVFQRDSHHIRQRSPHRLERFRAMVQAADQVFAGNDYLAETAALWTAPRKIMVVPTCLEIERYAPAQHHRTGRDARLVWIGSGPTLRVFESNQTHWEQIGQALPGLKLHVICNRFPQMEHIEVVPISWDAISEGEQLAQGDIGIAWMPEDDWSRGKCGLKVMQYLAAGLPVVVNPVGVHRQMIQPELNGYWAQTPDEWIHAIGLLRENANMRQSLGARGRRLIQQHYSTGQLIQRWSSALRKVEETRQSLAG